MLSFVVRTESVKDLVRTGFKVKLVIFAIIAGTIVWFAATLPDDEVPPPEFVRALTEEIREEESALSAYANDVVQGDVAQEPGLVTYSRDALGDTRIGKRVVAVTKDTFENVYFVLEGSWVTFNAGFVWRNGDRRLLGDLMEPEVTHEEPLFDDWWYYVAR